MHLMDFDPSFVRQRNEVLGEEVATHRLARRLRDAGRGNQPQVFGEAGKGVRSRAIPVLAAVISLLFALTLWIAAEPVHAQELSHTLTVSVTGGGKVTGPGIDCGAGATDCSESYEGEFRRVCEPDPDTGRPVCYEDWYPSTPTLSVNTPAGFRFQGWGGACTGTGNTCTVVVDAQKTVAAGWTDVAHPTVSLDAPAGPYVAGTTTLKATASDNDQVSHVEFFAWDSWTVRVIYRGRTHIRFVVMPRPP